MGTFGPTVAGTSLVYCDRLFAFGLLLLGKPDPGLRHFKEKCLVGRIERGPHQAQAFSRPLLTFLGS
jgi:hypothetical protein